MTNILNKKGGLCQRKDDDEIGEKVSQKGNTFAR
jgi:hypothetical protein